MACTQLACGALRCVLQMNEMCQHLCLHTRLRKCVYTLIQPMCMSHWLCACAEQQCVQMNDGQEMTPAQHHACIRAHVRASIRVCVLHSNSIQQPMCVCSLAVCCVCVQSNECTEQPSSCVQTLPAHPGARCLHSLASVHHHHLRGW